MAAAVITGALQTIRATIPFRPVMQETYQGRFPEARSRRDLAERRTVERFYVLA